MACGLASYGRRPVFELQFIDFIYPGWNQLVTNLATLRHDITNILSREPEFGQIPPFWDGLASERIVSRLIEHGAH